MKIQCSCGAKYEFDITPAMVNNPVRFVCAACGVDASEFVDTLVRRELGQSASPSGIPQPVVAVPTMPAARAVVPPSAPPAPPAPAPAAAPAPVRLAVHVARPAAAAAPAEAQAASGESEFPLCSKHPGQVAAERCCVCSRPICPKCMQLFGYVCSPLCRGKAEAQGIEVPVFAGQKSVVERQHWRKVGLSAGGIAAVVLLLLGTWCWYEWYGARPHTVFAVRFPEMAYSGSSFMSQNQIVFLHGGTLARHDLKQNKAVWTRELLDSKKLDQDAAKLLKELEEEYASSSRGSFKLRPPTLDKLRARVEKEAAAELQLFVRDHNVWVATPGNPGKLVRYNWDTGAPEKELPLQQGLSRLSVQGDELVALYSLSDSPVVAHINMNTCEVQNENPGRPLPSRVAQNGSATNGAGSSAGTEMAGLPTIPGQDAGKPLDPAKVAEQASRLSYPARVALPATLAANLNQERALSEMKDDEGSTTTAPGKRKASPPEYFTTLPTSDGFVQFSTRLLESRITERKAMKAPPAKSALDNLTAGNTADAANEILNEIQRSRGGDVVQEDESRYQITVRTPGQTGSWTGEVVGPPELYPLKTVNVVGANKMIVVLDKSNKKLWQSPLSFNIPRGFHSLFGEDPSTGEGPCVERTNTLFVCDAGMLTAFDLATGNARWRLPCVGITGLFFDDEGMVYINGSSASPDSIKYSRQIDITQKTKAVVYKVDPKDGKVLWQVEPGGPIDYLSGKFIYTVSSNQPEDSDSDSPYTVDMNSAAFLRIRRISPKNGHIVWEHGQPRCPLDIQFDKNTIRLVFRKEVQVLKFLSF